MKSVYNHPEESPGYLLWKITTEWQRQLRQALASLDSTHVQFVFLVSLQWLTKNKALVTQNQLAEHAKLDKMVISDTAKKLLHKQLIEREDHASDSRSYTLKLTPKGRKLIDKALPIVESVDKQFFQAKKRDLLNLGMIVKAL